MDLIIQIINHNTEPAQTAYVSFESIEVLLLHLSDLREGRRFEVVPVSRSDVPDCKWGIHISTSVHFSRVCREDGICGICFGALPSDNFDDQSSGQKTVRRGTIRCIACGRIIGMRVNDRRVKRGDKPFTSKRTLQNIESSTRIIPRPITCGYCGGDGYCTVSHEGHIFIDPCSECGGTGAISVPNDVLYL